MTGRGAWNKGEATADAVPRRAASVAERASRGVASLPPSSPPTFDSRAYRDTMGQFCTGVVIVAGVESDELVGFAAQSFVSLSLQPPLVAFCPAKSSVSWPRIRSSGRFCVNVLADDQQDVSDAFAQPGLTARTRWATAPVTGAPVLTGVIAYVECVLMAEHQAGDHTIVVSEAVGFKTVRPDARPLLYFRGGYLPES